MKKILVMFLLIASIATISACGMNNGGKDNASGTGGTNTENQLPDTDVKDGGNDVNGDINGDTNGDTTNGVTNDANNGVSNGVNDGLGNDADAVPNNNVDNAIDVVPGTAE